MIEIGKHNSITILGELFSLKNSKQIYRFKRGQKDCTALMPSTRYQKEVKKLIMLLNANRQNWNEIIANKEPPYRVNFLLYRKTRRPFDYVNIVQGLLDSMIKAGYFEDDNMNYIIPNFTPYKIDKDNPRTIITVI